MNYTRINLRAIFLKLYEKQPLDQEEEALLTKWCDKDPERRLIIEAIRHAAALPGELANALKKLKEAAREEEEFARDIFGNLKGKISHRRAIREEGYRGVCTKERPMPEEGEVKDWAHPDATIDPLDDLDWTWAFPINIRLHECPNCGENFWDEVLPLNSVNVKTE